MTESDLKLLSELTSTILEVVGKDKVKDYSKWQLQCLAYRIRTEAEQLQRIIDNNLKKP